MRIQVVLCALALNACAVHRDAMTADAYMSDSDGSISTVDANKHDSRPDSSDRDAGDAGEDASEDAAVDAELKVDADVDASEVELDAGTDSAVPPVNTQCQPCAYDEDCVDGTCSSAPGQAGVCFNRCSTNDTFCTTENGLSCQPGNRCTANVNFFPGGCAQWLEAQ